MEINKRTLEKLGWIDQNDRGMSENNGYAFTNPKYPKHEIRLWTIHPRFNLLYNGRVIYDTEDKLF